MPAMTDRIAVGGILVNPWQCRGVKHDCVSENSLSFLISLSSQTPHDNGNLIYYAYV